MAGLSLNSTKGYPVSAAFKLFKHCTLSQRFCPYAKSYNGINERNSIFTPEVKTLQLLLNYFYKVSRVLLKTELSALHRSNLAFLLVFGGSQESRILHHPRQGRWKFHPAPPYSKDNAAEPPLFTQQPRMESCKATLRLGAFFLNLGMRAGPWVTVLIAYNLNKDLLQGEQSKFKWRAALRSPLGIPVFF